jgi:hypothetical protein
MELRHVHYFHARLCFITSRPIEEVVSELKSFGIAIEEGPALRTGATGSTMSVSNYAT